MKLLVYGIVSSAACDIDLPEAISGRKVRLSRADDLAAAVSEVPDAPSIKAEEAMAFAAVVEWFHERCRALIPVRFPCVLDGQEQIVDVLRRNAEAYRRMLVELEQTCEIGLRLMREVGPQEFSGRDSSVTSGTAWLEARRDHYRQSALNQSELERIENELKSRFAGMYLRTSRESTPEMQSMYFLVSREQAESFLERAAHTHLPGNKILVSGPWPPYNFVNAPVVGSG